MKRVAQTLRDLHQAKSPYLEQSVQGGTQTDRNLFLNHDRVIQRFRSLIESVVREYVSNLPPFEPDHPLLSTPREQIVFEGSWSVRLAANGFHSVHTHTNGWVSSACYVSLPDKSQLGDQPAGWITFGEPPPELKLDLPPYQHIEPQEGRLVLFPSTMWHGTKPFDEGERLTLAFDVSVPKY